VHSGFWWGNLRERDHLEDLGLDRRIILKRIFKKNNGKAWARSAVPDFFMCDPKAANGM
jgi:hypothetical protein